MDLQVKQLLLGPAANFFYLLFYSGECAVIDPGWDLDSIIKAAGNINITKVLLTHHHFDHTNALIPLVKNTNIKVYMNKIEIKYYNFKCPNLIPIDEQEIIELGSLKIKNIHTPGHTKGSTCFIAENNLFTGDTLFINGYGRCDLDGGDTQEMKSSLKKISELPDNYIIYCGHNYGGVSSTILEQRPVILDMLKYI